MTTQFQRKLPRALFAASLALTGALASFAVTASPAQAAAPRSGYAASLASPVSSPRREIVGGVLWKCEGDRCSAAGQGSRPVLVCERVARKFGAVARFTAPEGELSTEDISRCNGAR